MKQDVFFGPNSSCVIECERMMTKDQNTISKKLFLTGTLSMSSSIVTIWGNSEKQKEHSEQSILTLNAQKSTMHILFFCSISMSFNNINPMTDRGGPKLPPHSLCLFLPLYLSVISTKTDSNYSACPKKLWIYMSFVCLCFMTYQHF